MVDLSFEGPNIETFIVGNNIPTSVIAKEKPWYVQVKWRTIGTDWTMLAGSWDLGVFLEPIGSSGSSLKLPDKHLTIPLNPEIAPVSYGPINFEFEAHSVDAGVYKIGIVLTLVDLNENLTPMAGFAEKLITILELHESTVVEQTISTAIDIVMAEQEISTGVGIAEDGKNIVIVPEGVEVGKSSDGQSVVIPYDKTFDKMGNYAKFAQDQLELSYKQRREQSNRWYQISIVAAVVGIIIITVGVITLIRGDTSMSIVSTISSVITETIAALFFVQSRQANEKVDKDMENLKEIHEMNYLVGIADSMNDPKDKDKLKAKIVRDQLIRYKKTEKDGTK